MKRRSLLRPTALGAGSLALPALAPSERRIVLGQSAALSGPAAQLGLQFQLGAKLAFERANARGGVNGRSVEPRSLDDGYEPARCQANTQALLADEVLALFGCIGTPTSLAALPLATAAKTPFIAPFTGAQALREPFNRNAFHLRASRYDETARIVNQVAQIGAKRVAVFHQNDSDGQAGLDGMTRALNALTNEFLTAAAAAQPKVQANYSSIEGYIAARAVLEGLRRAGAGATREMLIAGLESMQNIDLGGFVVDFSPRKRVASSFVDLTILGGDGHIRR